MMLVTKSGSRLAEGRPIMKRSPGVVLGVLLAAATALLLLASPASARHPSLRGIQINVLVAPPVQTLSASEPSFLIHGWVACLRDFAALSAEEKREFLVGDDIWRFELFVNGVPVPLDRTIHEVFAPLPDCIGLGKWHFMQFDANHFAPGTYVFEGRWYGDNDGDDVSELEILRVVTVIFT